MDIEVTNHDWRLPPGYTVLDLNEAYDSRVFHEFYDAVLTSSLPPSELEPVRTIEERIQRGTSAQTLAKVVLSPERRPIAGVVSEWYPRSRCLLVGYLAVQGPFRSQRIGTALVQHMLDAPTAAGRPELTLAEVDDPRVATSGDPIARLRFFGRLSARLLWVPYVQPEVRPGEGRVPMLLAVLQAAPTALVDDGAVRGDILRSFLEEYFGEAEGNLAVEDPLLAALLPWTTSNGGIPLLALERFRELPRSAWDSLR